MVKKIAQDWPKLLGAITALIGAVTALFIALSGGGETDSDGPTVIYINGPGSYEQFLEDNPNHWKG